MVIIKPKRLLSRLEPRLKLWLELDGVMVLGKGGALLLRAIDKYGSISQAVQSLPVGVLGEMEPPSYRFAWGYLRKVEKRLGAAIVKKHRGHRAGTGGTALTPLGHKLLQMFEELENRLLTTLTNALSNVKSSDS